MVKFLIENDVDPSLRDRLGRTAEDIAEEYGHTKIKKYLRSISEEASKKGAPLLPHFKTVTTEEKKRAESEGEEKPKPPT